jgi:hypothetical protein
VAWIDIAYFRNMVGTSQATALGCTTSGGVFGQFESEATSVVSSLLKANGYTPPVTLVTAASSTPFLRKLVASLVARDLYGFRSGIEFPPGVRDGIAILAAYERGEGKRFPVPGMDQDTADGVGGSSVTPSESWDGDARPMTFARSATRGL